MGVEIRPHAMWLGALMASILLSTSKVVATEESSSHKSHSRQKRVLWITRDGRLALPPGTAMSISASVSMPFVRYPPDGFLSNISVTLPFSISFDKLGLTDNENPYGLLPPFLGRSLGRSAGSLVADYIASLINRRTKRASDMKPPAEANFHGGERAILYAAVEDLLTNFGYDGKACLLRTICEIQGRRVEDLGLFGEFFKLFLTASRSPFSEILKEYVEAEEAGLQDGECWKYYKNCPKSIFISQDANKYRRDEAIHEEDKENEVDSPGPKDSQDSVEMVPPHMK